MMRIIMLGPPGSGKGTQAFLIEDKYGFPKISTGDLLRWEVEEKTALGLKAKEAMDKGHLVSDELVVEIVKKRTAVEDCKQGYVLDGFPRTISQAKSLEKIDKRKEEVVLDFQVKESTLIKRLSSRRICADCGAVFNLEVKPTKKEGICDVCGGILTQRQDDEPEVVRERLKVYKKQTEPLVNYYKKKRVYFQIDAEKTIPEVFKQVSEILEKQLASEKKAGQRL